jgi:hypothetical protein
MHESLQLFEDIVKNPIFANTPIFVFLNKKDLFEQMVSHITSVPAVTVTAILTVSLATATCMHTYIT